MRAVHIITWKTNRPTALDRQIPLDIQWDIKLGIEKPTSNRRHETLDTVLKQTNQQINDDRRAKKRLLQLLSSPVQTRTNTCVIFIYIYINTHIRA
jgi:hypothetical protein